MPTHAAHCPTSSPSPPALTPSPLAPPRATPAVAGVFSKALTFPHVACSPSTCKGLGWDLDDRPRRGGDPRDSSGSTRDSRRAVCGSVAAHGCTGLTGDGGGCLDCSGRRDWFGARDYCESAGARLCTLEELKSFAITWKGCGYDSELIWSSTRCGAELDNSFFAVR